MAFKLTKVNKMEIGVATKQGGYEPTAFTFKYSKEGEEEFVKLSHKEGGETFLIFPSSSQRRYNVRFVEPGTEVERKGNGYAWGDVLSALESWTRSLKAEHTAIDPWEEEAEEMANDETPFTSTELVAVDRAVDASTEELRRLALDHGKKLEDIQGELSSINETLKSSARHATRKEWLSIFKGIILQKMVDWGINTALFQLVLHTLITSAHDVAEIAEHAARHLSLQTA